LSSKPKAHPTKKAAVKKAEAMPVAKVRWLKPVAAPPRAVVSTRHEGEMISRDGRGFSMGELESAEFPQALARSWSVPLDVMRRSVLEANVESLKGWFAGARKEKPEEPKPAKQEKAEKPERAEKPKKAAPKKKKAATG